MAVDFLGCRGKPVGPVDPVRRKVLPGVRGIVGHVDPVFF
jgi:hypothetical protein